MPPSSVSGAAPWQWLWQRVGASKWPPAPRRQFTKHVDLRAATFGCGSSFLAVLDPSAAFPAVLRARSAVVFAGLRLVVGVWAETVRNEQGVSTVVRRRRTAVGRCFSRAGTAREETFEVRP